MFHRHLTSPDEAAGTNVPGMCFSLWDDRFLFLDARTKPALYVFEREKIARGIYPGPHHAAHIRITEAVQPLTLGVAHMYPGMARWTGDAFAVVSMADKKPMWIRGRLAAFSNDIPVELRVQYSNDMGVADYRIAYDYAAYRAPWYPSRIASHFVRGDQEVLLGEWHLLSLATAPGPLPESHFNPLATSLADSGRLLYLTNDSIYSRLPSGQFLETPYGAPAVQLASKDYHRNRYFYAAAGAWTIALLALGWRTQQSAKHKHQPKEDL
jgi:hypothetical protein